MKKTSRPVRWFTKEKKVSVSEKGIFFFEVGQNINETIEKRKG